MSEKQALHNLRLWMYGFMPDNANDISYHLNDKVMQNAHMNDGNSMFINWFFEIFILVQFVNNQE